MVIDKIQLVRHIQHALQDRKEIALGELIEQRPLEHGLAELIAYLQLGSEQFRTEVDESIIETITWQGLSARGDVRLKEAQLPKTIFRR